MSANKIFSKFALASAILTMPLAAIASSCDNSPLLFTNNTAYKLKVNVDPTNKSHLANTSDSSFTLSPGSKKTVLVKSGSGSWGDASGNITTKIDDNSSDSSKVAYRFYRSSIPGSQSHLKCFAQEGDNKLTSNHSSFNTVVTPWVGGTTGTKPEVEITYS